MTNTLMSPTIARKEPHNTYRYAGGAVSVLLTGDETGGTLSAWESVQKPGGEPALHVHHTSDETFFVLEGNLRFMVGDRIIDAPAGSTVFAPRGVPHTFRVKSEYARAITVCTPAGFEEWFQTLGTPAAKFEIDGQVQPFSEGDREKMITLARKLQVEIIGDVEF